MELESSALPSIRRVVAMLRRHTQLRLSLEAHCGIEPDADWAVRFTRRRCMSVRRAMERIADTESGATGSLRGRLRTRAWGNSRPLVWETGDEGGKANRRVEIYLALGEGDDAFEAPKRRRITE